VTEPVATRWPFHPAADLFPLLDGNELQELAEDIRANGLIEPIWLWNEPDVCLWLLDGRNRLRACEIAGVHPVTRFYTGEDPIGFSISQNMKRRHLTVGQKAAVGAQAEPLYAAEAAKRKAQVIAESNRRRAQESPDPIVADRPQLEGERIVERKTKPAPKARDQAAKTAGTSGRSVARFKRIQREASDLAEKVKSGAMALDRAERIIRDREAERRRVEQAKKEAAAAAVATRVDIRHGDFREVLADLENVDAVITDPPYPAEYLPLLADLGAWADKVLAPDGVLAVLIGQTHLEEVYRLLSGHRPYRWTACYLTEGRGYVSHPRRVQSNWKPVIVYGGGPRFGDIIRSGGADEYAKSNHRWGQDYSAFHTLIERLTDRGQTVVDPFMGSGTTLLAAHALGRHAIGCDVDAAAVATSRERIA
jgi:hypothetical protein